MLQLRVWKLRNSGLCCTRVSLKAQLSFRQFDFEKSLLRSPIMEMLRAQFVPSGYSFGSGGGGDAGARSAKTMKLILISSRSRGALHRLFSVKHSAPAVKSSRTVKAIQARTGMERTNSTNLPAEVVATWRNAQAVCFDVDSTVCEDEGIDELAAFCGAGEAVAAWTARAMGGTVPFQDALAARLALFRPSVGTLAKYLETRPPRLNKGITELFSKLHSRGTDVYLVSGGFRQMIAPVAAKLHIPSDNVFANMLLFGDDGEYIGFDTSEPTSRSGGKALVVERIKMNRGYQSLVMVGDGATDLEARRPGGADLFVCYGGVVARPAVVAGSDWFVTSFEDLIESLD